MYDYGNTRVAARRSRLLDTATLVRLSESGTPAALLALLERSDDWRPILRDVQPLEGDAAAAVEASIERHRSARLGALPGFYPFPVRPLVEALVMPLDLERLLAVFRRRRAGEDPEAISATIVGGALFGPAILGRVARASTLPAALRIAADAGILPAEAVRRLAGLAGDDDAWARFETALAEAVDAARLARVRGHGADRALVREIVAAERRDRTEAAQELRVAGAAGAAALERTAALSRLAGTARRARREPLGIGVPAGYVAAVEAQAIALRAALARVAAGWPARMVGTYLQMGA